MKVGVGVSRESWVGKAVNGDVSGGCYGKIWVEKRCESEEIGRWMEGEEKGGRLRRGDDDGRKMVGKKGSCDD